MTELTINLRAGWRDYYEMCKPRVVLLMVLTSVVGMFLAVPGMVPLDVLVLGNLGIALVAGAGAVCNHLIDRKIDLKMKRTQNRPLPQGRVGPKQTIVFALVIGLAGMSILLFWVNPLCAWLTLGSFVGYAFIYTGYLKHATPQNIVIGGLAGAMPPLLGWSAVTGTIEPGALILVFIIFAWTPPHFWALAVHRKDEYAQESIPMLPVTHGIKFTKLQIILYTIILFLVSLFPYLVMMSGTFYLISATVLGSIFLYLSIKFFNDESNALALPTFNFSIYYILLIFLALLVDHFLL